MNSTSSAAALNELMDSTPMSYRQTGFIVFAILLCALDGYDLLSMSFAAPMISEQLSLNSASLGVLLSMELMGMGVGSFVMGMLADRFGRRPAIIASILAMASGMLFVPSSNSFGVLAGWRVCTGIGIGGLLACCTALVSELSSLKRRNMNVTLMAAGFPVGGIAGGLISSVILESHSWEPIFFIGAIASFALLPFAFWLVPESPQWILQAVKHNRDERVTRALAKLRKPALQVDENTNSRPSISNFKMPHEELKSDVRKKAIATASVYFLQVTTYYFLLKWIPSILVDQGVSLSRASILLMWVNVGGVVGGIAFAFLSVHVNLRVLLINTLFLSFVGVVALGIFIADPSRIVVICVIAGFFGNAGVIGIYPFMARIFPLNVRATATGFCLAAGRLGAIISPIAAGFMLSINLSVTVVSLLMGVGSLVAGIILWRMKSENL